VVPATANRVDDLIHDLKFGTPKVRLEAADALGEIGDKRSVGPLIDYLQDEYLPVQNRAAWALGDMSLRSSLSSMLSRMSSGWSELMLPGPR